MSKKKILADLRKAKTILKRIDELDIPTRNWLVSYVKDTYTKKIRR